MNKIPCSISILTFNSGTTLRRCLDSVREFDDIVVCDGGSTDDTVSIANDYGCRIIYQDQCFKNPNNTIADFSGVRNQQLDAARFDWFMFIDSDEYISEGLVEEIREVVARDLSQPAIFMVPRKYVRDGYVIDCATTYPNYQIRFFNKRAVKRFIRKVHEKIEIRENYMVAKLKNYEYVPLEDIQRLKRKWSKYLEIEKENMGKSLFSWIRSGLLHHLAISALYSIRYLKIISFCKGNKMPLSYELLRIWYNFEVIKIGFFCIIGRRKNNTLR